MTDLVGEVARACAAPGARAERSQEVADLIRRGTGHRWVGVYSVAGGTVALEAWSGPAPPAYPEFPADRGLTGAAIAARDVVLSNDVTTDPRYLTNSATTGSELIAPVLAGSRVVGTIDLESDRLGTFAEADADLARRLAATVAPLWAAP
jgi:putative methionine-R-sulfoxide reductase with GAF domain